MAGKKYGRLVGTELGSGAVKEHTGRRESCAGERTIANEVMSASVGTVAFRVYTGACPRHSN